MSQGAGFSSKTVWKKEATQSDYGTPIECGADDQIPLVTEDLDRAIEKELDNVVRYKAGYGSSAILTKGVEGSITLDLVYRGMEAILVAAMGLCNYSASPETVVAGVYKHTIELDENIHSESWLAGDGILAGSGYLAGDNKVRRGTLCIDKTVSIWEIISSMIQEMTIRGDSKAVRAEFNLAPYNMDRASAVNTSAAAWSIPDDDFLSVIFQDMVIWIDDYSDSVPLTDADAVGVSAIEVKLENNLAIGRDSVSGLYLAEPKRNGKRLVRGSFTFPRYESDDFLGDLDVQTAKMAMIRFVGSQIGSTGYYRTIWIWLPTIRFDEVSAPVEGPGLLTATHTFTAELPAALPSGFPAAATKEMVIQVQNDLATNPLV